MVWGRGNATFICWMLSITPLTVMFQEQNWQELQWYVITTAKMHPETKLKAAKLFLNQLSSQLGVIKNQSAVDCSSIQFSYSKHLRTNLNHRQMQCEVPLKVSQISPKQTPTELPSEPDSHFTLRGRWHLMTAPRHGHGEPLKFWFKPQSERFVQARTGSIVYRALLKSLS